MVFVLLQMSLGISNGNQMVFGRVECLFDIRRIKNQVISRYNMSGD